MAERTDVTPLLRVFAGGTPNHYHRALARFAAAGRLRTILTTNFDTLIEDALEDAGLQRGRHYLLYDDPRRFKRIRWASAKIILIKLHGTISDIAGLAVTLEKVASRNAAAQAGYALKPLLAGARCQQLVVTGYSFSDVFDIVPILREAEPWIPHLVHVVHGGDDRKRRRSQRPPPGLSGTTERLEVAIKALGRRPSAPCIWLNSLFNRTSQRLHSLNALALP